jgi:hypothetical protein
MVAEHMFARSGYSVGRAMSEIPEGDDEDERPRPRSNETPEADALEQAAEVGHVGHRAATRSAEVPEADAAEQDQIVPDDEDDVD